MHTSPTISEIVMGSPEEEPPETPAEFEEFELAIKRKTKDWGLQETQVDMSLPLFFGVVRTLYNSSIAKMIEQSHHAGENARCSVAVMDQAKLFHWSDSTAKKYLCIMKKMLPELSMNEGFVKSLQFPRSPQVYNKILGQKYGALDVSNPTRKLLESWIKYLKENTRNRSDISIRNIMAFYISTVLPHLSLNVEKWPEDPKPLIEKSFEDETCVPTICGTRDNPNASKRARWLQLLVIDILGTDVVIPTQYLKNSQLAQNQGDEDDDGSDKHRISSTDLDTIYNESKKNPRDE